MAYVEQVLVPTLTAGDIVVMDNLSSRKVTGVREAIAAGAPLCACCPPIAPTSIRSSRLSQSSKHCSAAVLRAPIEALWNALGSTATCFTPAECANYFRNSGYLQSGEDALALPKAGLSFFSPTWSGYSASFGRTRSGT